MRRLIYLKNGRVENVVNNKFINKEIYNPKLDRNGYAPSILQSEEECWVSHAKNGLVRHEVFPASNRDESKYFGLWVYLTPYWHDMSNEGVHFNKELDLKLRKYAQAEFEIHFPELDFVEIFGKNYL